MSQGVKKSKGATFIYALRYLYCQKLSLKFEVMKYQLMFGILQDASRHFQCDKCVTDPCPFVSIRHKRELPQNILQHCFEGLRFS